MESFLLFWVGCAWFLCGVLLGVDICVAFKLVDTATRRHLPPEGLGCGSSSAAVPALPGRVMAGKNLERVD
jgi:hypothetical protein